MKANAISPTIMNVIPNPRRPGGTLLYFSFSRIPASATIANAQPNPDAKPNSTLCTKLYSRSTMNSEPPRIAQFTVISGRKIPSAL